LGWAEVLEALEIFIGVNAVDYSGYPDCRPEFISAFEQLANLATKAGVEGKAFQIHTPLIHLSKGEIIQQGIKLGVDYSLEHQDRHHLSVAETTADRASRAVVTMGPG
jgi:7-cyano-7-deazaguanine synthase